MIYLLKTNKKGMQEAIFYIINLYKIARSKMSEISSKSGLICPLMLELCSPDSKKKKPISDLVNSL